MSGGALPGGRQRSLYWVMLGFFLLLLAWACIGRVDVVVTAPGRIVPDGYSKVIQAPVGGTIERILVREGDFVKAGASLVQLDARIQQAQAAATRERINQLRAELSRLASERSGGRPDYGQVPTPGQRATQEALRGHREELFAQRQLEGSAAVNGRRSALEAGRSALAGLQARLKVAREKEEDARPHAGIGIPRFQYLQWKEDLIHVEREIDNQRRINERLQFEYEEAQHRLSVTRAERRAGILAEINDREAQLNQLKSELDMDDKRLADSLVKSPVDGYVQKMHVTAAGASVKATDPLAVVVPKNAPLLVEAYLSNQDRGFVRPGQHVDVKFDAYPFQKYGKLPGTLAWVSPDSEEEPASQSTSGKTSRWVFRTKIRLQQVPPGFELVPGMSVKVDMFTDSRRIIDFFLFPVAESTEGALRVR